MLAAVLVSAEVEASVASVSMDAAAVSSSSEVASSSWAGWAATGASVTLRRGNNGDLLAAAGNGAFDVVVFGCTCSRLRLRSLFNGFDVVARAGGGLVSAGAWAKIKTAD